MTQNNERESLLNKFREIIAEQGWQCRDMTEKLIDAAYAHIQSPISQNEQQEAVAPELFWNKGDEYVMQGNEEVFNWATYNDYSHGESFDLEYSINGTATFMVYGDTVELADFSPKYYTLPPKQIPDGWKLVPIVLTRKQKLAMISEYEDATGGCRLPDGDGYDEEIVQQMHQAMINASPTTSLTSETNTEVGK